MASPIKITVSDEECIKIYSQLFREDEECMDNYIQNEGRTMPLHHAKLSSLMLDKNYPCVPFSKLNTHLGIKVRGGYKFALCDMLKSPDDLKESMNNKIREVFQQYKKFIANQDKLSVKNNWSEAKCQTYYINHVFHQLCKIDIKSCKDMKCPCDCRKKPLQGGTGIGDPKETMHGYLDAIFGDTITVTQIPDPETAANLFLQQKKNELKLAAYGKPVGELIVFACTERNRLQEKFNNSPWPKCIVMDNKLNFEILFYEPNEDILFLSFSYCIDGEFEALLLSVLLNISHFFNAPDKALLDSIPKLGFKEMMKKQGLLDPYYKIREYSSHCNNTTVCINEIERSLSYERRTDFSSTDGTAGDIGESGVGAFGKKRPNDGSGDSGVGAVRKKRPNDGSGDSGVGAVRKKRPNDGSGDSDFGGC